MAAIKPDSTPKPLSILDMSGTQIKIQTDAINSVLDKVGDRRFVLFSMNGQTRTGKSYLLNHFLRYLESEKQVKQSNSSKTETDTETNWLNVQLPSEFEWRGGKERTTTGINLWSEPYFVTVEDEEVAVLLMDTQGLFDEQTTVRQNAIIFSISILCSSIVIFNQMHSMNEDFLQKIQFFSQYAHSATAEPQPEPNASLTDVFQKVLFVIRDFQYPDYDYGPYSSSQIPPGNTGTTELKNYYTDTFQTENRVEGYPEENKIVRKNIEEMFQSIAVYTLPDPGKTFRRQERRESEPQTTTKLPEPDEEFQENVKVFIEWMMSKENLLKKRVASDLVTGTEFKVHIQRCADLCEKAADEIFPHVPTMTESTAITHYSIAKQLALSLYKVRVEEMMRAQGKDVQLDFINTSATEEAWKLFQSAKKIKINNAEFVNKYVESLHIEINEHFEAIKNCYDEEMKYKKIQEIKLLTESASGIQIPVTGPELPCLTASNESVDREKNTTPHPHEKSSTKGAAKSWWPAVSWKNVLGNLGLPGSNNIKLKKNLNPVYVPPDYLPKTKTEIQYFQEQIKNDIKYLESQINEIYSRCSECIKYQASSLSILHGQERKAFHEEIDAEVNKLSDIFNKMKVLKSHQQLFDEQLQNIIKFETPILFI